MTEERIQRKLVAILIADVVGYSRLIRADENGTLRALKAIQKDTIGPIIARYGGRIVKLMGDGILAEFPSTVDAVQSAAEIQNAIKSRHTNNSKAPLINFRIGINLGDVVIDGQDIQGDGVNIASRLEGLSEPGGICISSAVHEQVRDRIDLAFKDMGAKTVKNFDRPIRAWHWTSNVKATTEANAAPDHILSLPEKPSIAVLPFINMSDDPEQEYFSDGITEDIITALSRLRWLFVIARNSTFAYKGQAVNIKTLGQDLGVRYVLEGSVRKAGTRVRVTAQLIEAKTENHIWAERYDRELVDIFDIQDDLTEAISININSELAGSERNLARKKSASDLDAWDIYQRGTWHLYKMSESEIAEARRLFQMAAEQAPDFPSPHAALGYLAAIEALSGFTENRDATIAAGLRDAERAVELDDRDGFNQFALGRICTVLGHRDRAVQALEKSIALNPNSANAHYGLGMAHYWVGHPEIATPYLDRAIRHSPHDPQLWTFYYIRGNAHYFLGDVDAAIADLNAAIREKGDEYLPYLSLAVTHLLHDGGDDKAREAYGNACKLKPGLTEAFLRSTFGTLHPPYLRTVFESLKELGLPAN